MTPWDVPPFLTPRPPVHQRRSLAKVKLMVASQTALLLQPACQPRTESVMHFALQTVNPQKSNARHHCSMIVPQVQATACQPLTGWVVATTALFPARLMSYLVPRSLAPMAVLRPQSVQLTLVSVPSPQLTHRAAPLWIHHPLKIWQTT